MCAPEPLPGLTGQLTLHRIPFYSIGSSDPHRWSSLVSGQDGLAFAPKVSTTAQVLACCAWLLLGVPSTPPFSPFLPWLGADRDGLSGRELELWIVYSLALLCFHSIE